MNGNMSDLQTVQGLPLIHQMIQLLLVHLCICSEVKYPIIMGLLELLAILVLTAAE